MLGNDTYTELLLHFDGANGATTTQDSSKNALAVSFVGATAALSTAQYKFGTASLLVDADSDYVSVPDNAGFNFADGAFTIDCWIRPKDDLNNFDKVIFDIGSAVGDRIILCTVSGVMRFYVFNAAAEVVNIATGTETWAADTWYHLAVIRGWGSAANDYAICINGTMEGTGTDASTMPDLAGIFRVGAGWDYGGTLRYMNGYIDEFRVSKGIARWTANFTPPTSSYGKQPRSGVGIGAPLIF